MRVLPRQRRRGRWFISWPVIIVLVAASVVMMRSVWRLYPKSQVAAEGHQAALLALEELEVRQETVERDIEELGTVEGIEGRLRSQLPVARPGERVITLVEPEPRPDSTAEPEPAEPSWWQRLWREISLVVK